MCLVQKAIYRSPGVAHYDFIMIAYFIRPCQWYIQARVLCTPSYGLAWGQLTGKSLCAGLTEGRLLYNIVVQYNILEVYFKLPI